MANTFHSAAVNAELHESKGTALAGAGELFHLYAWAADPSARYRDIEYCGSRFINNTAPSSVTLTAPTSFTTLSFSTGLEDAVTPNGNLALSAGPKITYSGSDAMAGSVAFAVTLRHSDASARLISVALMKNGAAVAASTVAVETIQDQEFTLADIFYTTFTQNDYWTICAKVPSGNLVVLNAFIRIIAQPTGA
jgi:hypothetical protein